VVQLRDPSFGEVVELLRHSRLHRSVRLKKLIDNFETPLTINQYRYWRNKHEKLVAFCAYALVSDEVLTMLRDGASMDKDWWQSGKFLWLAEFVAPFGHVSFIVKDTVRYFNKEHGIGTGYWYRPNKQKKGHIGPDVALDRSDILFYRR
jgi:hemolysin-activating ACP:hemolysin acyltransferase